MTKTLKFKCTLESDIVLSQTSSSEGNQKTLDFIPGNNFLGVVARELYAEGSTESLEFFHSGKLRFGDAHPSVYGIRGLKVPASMYYPKLSSARKECYIHHLTDHDATAIRDKQLKQCREGFYSFDEARGMYVDLQKNFTIKSAYDSQKRRSKDHQMFGYEALAKDLIMYFEIESDLSDEINKIIVDAICGKKHIGRSRTAEFGLVNIEQADYQEIVSSEPASSLDFVTVYADGRLIFLDENGEPTYQPTADALGVAGGEIDWAKSQIRTFQYAPWNGKRHTYDTERCGIEKGSVFVIRQNGASCPNRSQYVGWYKNEGFGKVIYNPAFLKGNSCEQGKALYTLEDYEDGKEVSPNEDKPVSSLIDFLLNKRNATESNQTVYQVVQDAVALFEPSFRKGAFASQWGSIRNIAMISPDSNVLISYIDSYLSHGIAKDKWEERGRKKRLDDFMKANIDKDLQSIMINLASEMAKKCKAREED